MNYPSGSISLIFISALGIAFTSWILFEYFLSARELDAAELEYSTRFDPDTISLSLDQNMEQKLSAFVFGASGGVGMAIVKALAHEPRFTRVMLFGRRQIEFPSGAEATTTTTCSTTGAARKTEPNYTKFDQQILNFDQLATEYNSSLLAGFDVGFYTLGISSTAANEETYLKIEYGYTMTIAKLAREAQVRHFHWLSGQGAKKNGRLLFARTKAQVEEELSALGFPRVSLYRPAGVLASVGGTGGGGGMAGKTVVSVLRCLDRWHVMSVEAERLGRVIVANTFKESDATSEILTNTDINKFGKELEDAEAAGAGGLETK